MIQAGEKVNMLPRTTKEISRIHYELVGMKRD
jgi:hypothetical protein